MKILLLMSMLLVVLVGAPEGSQSMAGKEWAKAATADKAVQLPATSDTIPFMATPVEKTITRKEGDAPTPITNLDNFQLKESEGWELQAARINELKARAKAVVTPSDVTADSSRFGQRIDSLYPLSETGLLNTGFHYDLADVDSCWMPQGLTGSADAGPLSSNHDDKKLLVVSWHPENCGARSTVGVRVSFIDVTTMNQIKYRHVLLVEPTGDPGSVTYNPVNVHAGGIVWAGDYLYVAHTGEGLRVFDMTSIMQVDVNNDTIGVQGDKMSAYGYEFILPQIGNYHAENGENTTTDKSMLFSWVSLDRSSTPPVLLTGEYNDENYGSNPRPSINGRAFLWPLNATSNKLDVDSGTKIVQASSAVYMNQYRIQGGFTQIVNGVKKFWFAGSHKAGNYKLYRKSADKGLEETISWPNGTPQNMTYSPASDNLWSLAESNKAPNRRPVWSVKLKDVD